MIKRLGRSLNLTYPKEQLVTNTEFLTIQPIRGHKYFSQNLGRTITKEYSFKAEFTLWRAHRSEFKAGALQRRSWSKTDSEFVAILDADFRSATELVRKGARPI